MSKKKPAVIETDLSHITEQLRPLAVPIDQPILDPANARLHPEPNLAALKGSLRVYGQRKPIVVNRRTNVVEAGNGTLSCGQALGWSHIAAVYVDDDPNTAAGFAVSDNRTAELATWDDDALDRILREIETGDEDLQAMLSQLAEDQGIIPTDEEAQPLGDPDEVPEPPVDPITKPGDLWILGDHRLLCGDSTKAEDVERVLAGRKIDVAITSPPYASQRKYDESSGFKPIHPDKYVEWWKPIQANVKANLAKDGSFLVNIKEHCEDGQRHLYVNDLVSAHVREWAWKYVDQFCWRNTANGVPGKWPNRLKNAWEPIFHFTTGDCRVRAAAISHASSAVMRYSPDNESSETTGFTGTNAIREPGMALPSNVVEAKSESAGLHPAPFPVPVPAFFIAAFSDERAMVFEPFGGSGTTLLAAEMLRRHCCCIELSPAYCDVIIKRWEKFTGRNAELAK